MYVYVSGVPENKILDGDYEGDEEERVDKAIEYIATYPLYIEIINDFGIEDISNIIKTYKREVSIGRRKLYGFSSLEPAVIW